MGQIQISKFAFGIGRGVSSPIGGTSNREASTPSVSEIALSKLLDEATGGLSKEAYNGAGKATAVISFVLEGVHAHDLGTILDSEGVAVRTGHHCAMPLMERLDVPATARASLGLYNTREDIDALVEGIALAKRFFA